MLPARVFPRLTSLYALLLLCLVCMPGVLGRPGQGPPGRKCKKIDKRKEWRDMTTRQKKDWHRAVLCLHGKPATSNFGGATTRFEQFQATHAQLGHEIHIVGQFLPWHRQIVTLFNNALRDECGYIGPSPYWDWPRDADNPAPIGSSPIFDTVTGFGGGGVPGTYTPPDGLLFPWNGKGCVQDGPYKNLTLNVGPDMLTQTHCLARGFHESYRENMTTSAVNAALRVRSFAEFIDIIDRDKIGIHGAAHFFVGGEMGNGFSSPGDPIFYLHHAQLDRVWWQWQQANPAQRLYEIAGFTSNVDPTTPTTLDFVIRFPGLGPDITVGDVMDASKQPSCFSY